MLEYMLAQAFAAYVAVITLPDVYPLAFSASVMLAFLACLALDYVKHSPRVRRYKRNRMLARIHAKRDRAIARMRLAIPEHLPPLRSYRGAGFRLIPRNHPARAVPATDSAGFYLFPDRRPVL